MSLIEDDDDIDAESDEIDTETVGRNPNATSDNPFFIAEDWPIKENGNIEKIQTKLEKDEARLTKRKIEHASESRDSIVQHDIAGKPIIKDELQGKLTFMLALSTMAVSLGSGSQLGYNGGGFSVPAPFLLSFLNHTNYDKWNGSASDFIITWIFSITVSMFLTGAAFGAIVGGRFGDVRGRRVVKMFVQYTAPGTTQSQKGSLLISNVLSIVGAVLMGVCQVADIYGLLVLGRFIVGIYVGITLCIAPIYLAEIAPINLRGAIGVFSAVMIAAGTVFAHLLYFGFFYSQEKWPICAALTGVLSVFQLIVLPFCPESPRWLLINQNRPEDAKKALQSLRAKTDVEHELSEMRMEAALQQTKQNVSIMDILRFKQPEWKMPLLLSCVVMVGVHLSGYSAVMFYTTSIYESAGMGPTEIAYATIGFSVLNTLMSGVSVLAVERVGRRPLILYPFCIGMVCQVGLTVSLDLGMQDKFDWMKWLSIGFVYLYISAFAIGPMSVKNLVATELWLQGPRPAALSFTMQLNYWASVFVSLTFPVFEQEIGSYTFLIYLGCLIIATVIIFLYFPETKNKTFDEIAAHLTKFSHKPHQHLEDNTYEMGAKGEDVRPRAYSALSAVSQVSERQFSTNVPSTTWL